MAENYERELREQADEDLERERQRIERVEELLLASEDLGGTHVSIRQVRAALADA